ncbi:hypothetical protein HanHA300_Chr11g0417491 [Helianthus annuus]|nr:hypothetical protein HanHA300_Chr11g0417491 [Helianthus annuus]KAJ0518802.1 hypothetical protein HanHA89_Chr11g0441511 [Helianthus annuus]KAJ0686824.1 hypothetical protein HanLR1_Chr11g0419081 [Helianthus annuus]
MMMIIWVACLIIFWTILLRLWMEMVLLNWASKLGPIPSEIFREKLPPVGNCIVGGSSGGCGDSIDFLNSIDFLTVCCGPGKDPLKSEFCLSSLRRIVTMTCGTPNK